MKKLSSVFRIMSLALGLSLVTASCEKSDEPDNPSTPGGSNVKAEYVDLGLPSGIKWATFNVGAKSPEDYGDYFAWGEITTKSTYNFETYLRKGLSFVDISEDTRYDVAAAKWGGNWRMPTVEECEELTKLCVWKYTTQSGVDGWKITGPNGKSIFLPAAGYRYEEGLDSEGYDCYYWTSTTSDSYDEDAQWLGGNKYIGVGDRYLGRSVRPVYAAKRPKNPTPTSVDLGLSVEWATFNVGACQPSGYGDYYAWGETSTKLIYNQYNCTTSDKIFNDIAGNKSYDVAAAKWGGDWRMPTEDECQELIDKCEWEATTELAVPGYKVTGPSGKSIFLPSGGSFTDRFSGKRNAGYYWSSTPEEYGKNFSCALLTNNLDRTELGRVSRVKGFSIRPVRPGSGSGTGNQGGSEGSKLSATPSSVSFETNVGETATTDVSVSNLQGGISLSLSGTNASMFGLGLKTSTQTTAIITVVYSPTTAGNHSATMIITSGTETLAVPLTGKAEESEVSINGHEYVDLGLPSGLKWATYNVGANAPDEYGDYFAWGEISPKSSYTTDNSVTYEKAFGDISGNPYYDAARANWGGSWRLPTKDEIQELKNKCTWTWVTQNRTNGYKVTGPNGNSIFLPAAGYRNGTSLKYAGSYGNYWSSTPYESDTQSAYYLYFDSSKFYRGWDYRYLGQSVRPVTE